MGRTKKYEFIRILLCQSGVAKINFPREQIRVLHTSSTQAEQ